jgi:hypothetical protein
VYCFGVKRDRQITIVYLNRRKRLPIQIVEKKTKQMQCKQMYMVGIGRRKEYRMTVSYLKNYARGESKSNRQNKVYLLVCRKRRKT